MVAARHVAPLSFQVKPAAELRTPGPQITLGARAPCPVSPQLLPYVGHWSPVLSSRVSPELRNALSPLPENTERRQN